MKEGGIYRSFSEGETFGKEFFYLLKGSRPAFVPILHRDFGGRDEAPILPKRSTSPDACPPVPYLLTISKNID